jgi:tRNA(Arg) A34 adenosine deaminase TadA
MSFVNSCGFELPGWVAAWLEERRTPLDSESKRMSLALALAEENVRQGTGGPFGAIIVDDSNHELVSVGVNLVTGSGLSVAHAEIVAISLAQRGLGDWNLGTRGHLQLVTSCEPCAMCFGAIPWSGVGSVVCGAGKADAERAGFDEGDKPSDWVDSLRRRGVQVHVDVLREEAARVFDFYLANGGTIYNAGPMPAD